MADNTGESTYSYSVSDDTYYTITMVIDENGIGKIYINARLIGTQNLGVSFPAEPANDFRIRGYGTTTNGDYYTSSEIKSNIHNILVYDRTLSHDEIKHIYKVDKIKY